MSLLIIAIAAFVVFYAVSKLFPMTLMAAIKVTSGRYEKLVVMVSGLKNGLQLLTPLRRSRHRIGTVRAIIAEVHHGAG